MNRAKGFIFPSFRHLNPRRINVAGRVCSPCSDWGEIATTSLYTAGKFQIIKLWWDKSRLNLSPSLHCWVLPSAGWWHINEDVASLFHCTHEDAPRCHLWGVWHHRDFFGTNPSRPALSSMYSSSSPHLFSSFWNTYIPPLWFPFALIGFTTYESQFYLQLQLSLTYSLCGAPLTMFYCFCVLRESMGQEKKKSSFKCNWLQILE